MKSRRFLCASLYFLFFFVDKNLIEKIQTKIIIIIIYLNNLILKHFSNMQK